MMLPLAYMRKGVCQYKWCAPCPIGEPPLFLPVGLAVSCLAKNRCAEPAAHRTMLPLTHM